MKKGTILKSALNKVFTYKVIDFVQLGGLFLVKLRPKDDEGISNYGDCTVFYDKKIYTVINESIR